MYGAQMLNEMTGNDVHSALEMVKVQEANITTHVNETV